MKMPKGSSPEGSGRKKMFDVRMAAPRVGEVLIYGDISSYVFWGDEMTPKALADAVKSLGEIDELHVRVFSYGGDACAGGAMYGYLNSLPVKKIGYVDGLAASAATMPLMACEKVYMDAAAVMLVHLPMSGMGGNMDDHRREADELETLSGLYAQAYAAKSGRTEAEMFALMREDRLLSPDEAMEYGLCDGTFEKSEKAAAYRPQDAAFARLEERPDVAAWMEKRGRKDGAQASRPKEKTGGKKKMTRDELMQQEPELVEALMAEGAQAERARMQEIDEMNLADGELVREAKYGEKRMEAKDVAYEAVKRAKGKPAAALKARMEEAEVTATAGAQQTTPEGDGREAKREGDAKKLADAVKHYMGM